MARKDWNSFPKAFHRKRFWKSLISEDPERELRQVGIVDTRGRAAAFTGKNCFPWAGHIVGENFACQGNILAGKEVVEAMAEAFLRTSGTLAERLLSALFAGQKAGGDRRGQQSAALLVVKEKGGYGGFNDRYMDLRVDDHPQPIEELRRLYELHQLYFAPAKPEEIVPLTENLRRRSSRSFCKSLGISEALRMESPRLNSTKPFSDSAVWRIWRSTCGPTAPSISASSATWKTSPAGVASPKPHTTTGPTAERVGSVKSHFQGAINNQDRSAQ
jgi:hypothetical protein